MPDVKNAAVRWWSRPESSAGFWPVPLIRPVNSLSLWIPVSDVLRMDVMGPLLSEGPGKGEPFTAAPTIPIVPMPYGINPFLKSALNATFLSWSRNRERRGPRSDAPRRNVDIVNQYERIRYLRLPSMIFFCVNRRCMN